MFALGSLMKGLSKATCTNREQMKLNMGIAIHQNKNKFLEIMQKAMTAILEHHFNGHMFWGEWCPALFWKDNKRVSKSLK
jgi:hypothetical protein